MSRAKGAARAIAILLPGFNGTARQPLLLALEKALTPLGVRCVRVTLPRGTPSVGLTREVDAVAAHIARVAGAGGDLHGSGRKGRVATRAGAPGRTVRASAGPSWPRPLPASPPVLLVGRSFGGRVAARYANAHGAGALVLLGFPVRPPGKQRPDDEAALLGLRAPTLIVQNTADPLGPLWVLKPLVKKNPRLRLSTVEARGHGTGRRQGEAIAHVVAFVDAYLRRRGV